MSSILTNTSSMVALQTLKGINASLNKTQDEISTGKTVASAKDNSAVWAISKVMESDVAGFKAISSSLALGESTVAVAQKASESVTDLLTKMKEKIVASQESNVDRSKLQTDITALKSQIASVTGAAQFNGLNLLSNSKTGATLAENIGSTVLGSGSVDVLSSLDRSASGVAASNITVTKNDLTTKAHVAGTGTDIVAAAFTAPAAAIASGASGTFTIVGDAATTRGGNKVLAGDTYQISAGLGLSSTIEYVARDGDTVENIAAALTSRINFEAAKSGVKIAAAVTTGGGFTVTNNTGAVLSAAPTATVKSGGTAGGGLELLNSFDVTTDKGAEAALGAVEDLISAATKAAASFGSVAGRLEIQSDFISSLTDSLTAGMGTLVDADMEEASARLQALQTQQQLGIQALSIANQAPQNILSLFK